MAEVVKEVVSVSSVENGLLLIRHDTFWENGFTMGGDFICEASAADWLADHIEAGADPCGAPDIDLAMPPDYFRVYSRGGEHGEDVNINIQNLRDPSAPRGRTYAISGVSPGAAKSLVAQLRALKPHSPENHSA